MYVNRNRTRSRISCIIVERKVELLLISYQLKLKYCSKNNQLTES
jgi:hypothetical protein